VSKSSLQRLPQVANAARRGEGIGIDGDLEVRQPDLDRWQEPVFLVPPGH